jgi:hypothetical protein
MMTSPRARRPVPADVEELVSEWIRVAKAYGAAHARDALTLATRHKVIGAPSVAASAIVGTSIFASLQGAPAAPAVKWALAMLSMAAAGLAALVTFHDFAERSTRHRIASEEYLAVARALEIVKTSVTRMPPSEWRSLLDGHSQRLEAIGTRVDLPSSMRGAAGTFGMFPEDRPAAPGAVSAMPAGFSEQLDALHALATKRA